MAVAEKKKPKPSPSPSPLGKLLKAAEPEPAKAAKKGAATLDLRDGSRDEIDAVDRLTSGDAIAKIAGKARDAAKNDALEFLARRYYRLCMEHGRKPPNPGVVTGVSTLNFVVKHGAALKGLPEDPAWIAAQLKSAGFDAGAVERVAALLTRREHLGIKRLTDLAAANAPPDHKAVAEKLIALLAKHLTEDELGIILEKTPETTIAETWQDVAISISLERAGGDLDRGAGFLAQLFEIVPPQFVCSQLTFAGELKAAFSLLQAVPVSPQPSERHAPGDKNRPYETAW